jgi:hypothetical protein
MSDELIPHVPVMALIAQYEMLKDRTINIFDNIDSLQKDLHTFIDDNYAVNHHLRSVGKDAQLREIRRAFWKYTAQKLQLYNLMSEKKKKEFDKQLYSEDLPEFNKENVFNTFTNLIDNVKSLIDDTILEVFNFLRPHSSEYKTNTEYAIGKRVIMNCMISCSKYNGKWSNPSLEYRHDQQLRCLDNAFSLMDGHGPSTYPGDSISVLRQAIKNRVINCETQYFKYKWYMKGSLHIEFKRMDLVAKMNAIGGKGLLNKEAA